MHTPIERILYNNKTKEEIINTVYDFCVENKIIGFENDW